MRLLRRWHSWRTWRRLLKEAAKSDEDITIQRGNWSGEWKKGQK